MYPSLKEIKAKFKKEEKIAMLCSDRKKRLSEEDKVRIVKRINSKLHRCWLGRVK